MYQSHSGFNKHTTFWLLKNSGRNVYQLLHEVKKLKNTVFRLKSVFNKEIYKIATIDLSCFMFFLYLQLISLCKH